jgi:transposase
MNTLITIPFHNQTVFAIEHDGQPYVAMRPIVENLGLDWKTQYRKIAEKFSKGMVILTIPSAGGLQETICLPLTKLTAFLYSINPSKVKPVLRETVIIYQDECDQVLFNHFIGHHQAEHQALTAMQEALFKKHPKWRQVLADTQRGLPQRLIAEFNGMNVRNVRRMQQRIRAAGIDCRPVSPLQPATLLA